MQLNPRDKSSKSCLEFDPKRTMEEQEVIVRSEQTPVLRRNQTVRVAKVWKRSSDGAVVISGTWEGKVVRRLKGVKYWEVFEPKVHKSYITFTNNLVAVQTSEEYPVLES